MNASSVQFIITNGITDYGTAMLAILGAVIAVIIGFFVFRSGVMWLRGGFDEDDITAKFKEKGFNVKRRGNNYYIEK